MFTPTTGTLSDAERQAIIKNASNLTTLDALSLKLIQEDNAARRAIRSAVIEFGLREQDRLPAYLAFYVARKMSYCQQGCTADECRDNAVADVLAAIVDEHFGGNTGEPTVFNAQEAWDEMQRNRVLTVVDTQEWARQLAEVCSDPEEDEAVREVAELRRRLGEIAGKAFVWFALAMGLGFVGRVLWVWVGGIGGR